MHELNSFVRRYWKIDEPKETLVVRPDEKFARDTVAKSLTSSMMATVLLTCLVNGIDHRYLTITAWP